MADCIFCAILEGQAPASVIHQDDRAWVILDLFPVHDGHALIIPRHHCERVEDLPESDFDHLFRLGRRTIRALASAGVAGDAQNLLINNGPAANQHVPHVHLHVLPRRRGDSPATMWSWSTRMLKRWSMNEKRRQLDQLAARISDCFPAGESQ